VLEGNDLGSSRLSKPARLEDGSVLRCSYGCERNKGISFSTQTSLMTEGVDYGGRFAWDGLHGIDKLRGAEYSCGSALTGRLLPAAREASHLFSFQAQLPSFSLVSAGHRQI
jgi:hypothetical protein